MFRYVLMALYALMALAVGSMALPAVAQEQQAGTLAQWEEKLRQHPQIAAYAQRVEASGSYAKGELGLPDPMVFIEQEDYRFDSDMGRGGGDTMLGLRQEIPRPALREARAGRLETESRKHTLLQDYAFAAMKAQMIATFAHLQKVRELRAIAREKEKLLTTQRKSQKGSIISNRAGLGSLSLTDAELQDIGITLSELEEEAHGLKTRLVNMLGEAAEISLPPVEMAAWNNDPAMTYPVMIAAVDADMAQKDVTIRKAEFGPNFEVQASAGRMNGGDSGGTLMLGMSIPLWAEASQKPRLNGAKAALTAAELDRDAVARQMTETLEHLKTQISTSAKKIRLLEQKEALLNTAAKAATRQYEAGKGDFALILETRRQAWSARAQVVAERAAHTTLIADFNRYIPEPRMMEKHS